jgi:diguanylate cyclase (GGDEF)-like protein
MKKIKLYSLLIVTVFIITIIFINHDRSKNNKIYLEQVTKQNQTNFQSVIKILEFNSKIVFQNIINKEEIIVKITKDINFLKNKVAKLAITPQITLNKKEKSITGFNTNGYSFNYPIYLKNSYVGNIDLIYSYTEIIKLMKSIFNNRCKLEKQNKYATSKTINLTDDLYKTFLPIYDSSKTHITTFTIIDKNPYLNKYNNNFIYTVFTIFSFLIALITLLFIKEKRRSQTYQDSAMTDTLTNIANRLKFNTIFEQQIKISNRTKANLCLILLDIDHFKQINDKYGHQSGDKILIKMVSIINKNIREADLFARWGGEEFVLIMPNTDIENGIKVSQKLRKIIESHTFNIESFNIKITISVGVGQYKLGEHKEIFMKRVDLALYQAKHAGRNQVKIANKKYKRGNNK